MYYIVIALTVVLLVITLKYMPRDEEKMFWGKILFFFVSFIFSIPSIVVSIPVAIFIAMVYVKKFSTKNINVKMITLFFAFALFVFTKILMPISISTNGFVTREQNDFIYRFNVMTEYQYFEANSKIQNSFRDISGGSPEGIFRAWVLTEKNIPIKDSNWLMKTSIIDQKIEWKVIKRKKGSEPVDLQKEGIEEYIKFKATGEEYLGNVKKGADGKYYLSMVGKGNIKAENIKPNPILSLFF